MYSILPIDESEIEEILSLADEIFEHVQKDTSTYVYFLTHWEISVKLTKDSTGEIIGFYLFNEDPLRELHGKGLQGVAIGLKEEYRGRGLGKRLICYPYEQLDYDYIWGNHLKGLNNLPDWQKRRKLIEDQGNVYVTAGSLRGNPFKLIKKFPYVAQPDGFSCGCTVLRMVMNKLSVYPEVMIPDIAAVCGTDSITGTTDVKMKKGLEYYGLEHHQNRTGGGEKEQLAYLDSLLAKGNVFALRGLVDGMKHWYLVFDRNEDYYYVNDPWLGRLVYHKEELLTTWRPREFDGFEIVIGGSD